MKYYFTFGCKEDNWNKYVVIEALTLNGAKVAMNAMHGNNWAGVYNCREDAGIERYHLTELK